MGVFMPRCWPFVFAVLAALIACQSPALAQKKLALVASVSNYDSLTDLPVAKHDARSVRTVLSNDLNFDVEFLEDPTRGEILSAWNTVLEKIESKKDIVVFYYAGHGIELRGSNFLIPKEVAFKPDPGVLISGSVAFSDLLNQLAITQKKKKVETPAVFILDACRNNPFTGAAIAKQVGLAPLSNLPKSVFVMYSAGIGQEAIDGPPGLAPGQIANSVYTRRLIPLLKQQGQPDNRVSLSDLAQMVRHQVYLDALRLNTRDKRTGKLGPHYQTPAYYDQLRVRLTLVGKRAQPRILEPIGTTLSSEAVSRGLGQGDIIRECLYCPELAVVDEQASFLLGSPSDEVGRRAYEAKSDGKQLKVSFSKKLAFGRFEVTKSEWNACVEDTKKSKIKGGCDGTPYDFSTGKHHEREPVTDVSWDDAQKYVTWLNATTKANNSKYRLPSEAEWEFAARANDFGRYSFSRNAGGEKKEREQLCTYANGADRAIGTVAWLNYRCTDHVGRRTAQVGSYKPNAFGLHDMHGNVAEWVEDCWHKNYDKTRPDGSAYTDTICWRKVVRGGSWRSSPAALRSAARNAVPPDVGRATLGFRVVRELD